MKPIGPNEVQNLRHAIQYFQDCYLVSSVGALTRSENGRKILQENIAHIDDGYRVTFRNINTKSEDFLVTQKEMDDLVYMDKYMNAIPIDPDRPHNPIIKAIEVAMNKILDRYPSKKPFICRFANCNEKFEFNKPSNFFEMFTGQKPLSLNEKGLRLNLSSKQQACRDLFEKISDNPDSSFVVGSSISFRKFLHNFHCFSVTDVNKDGSMRVFDHRAQTSFTLSFEEVVKNLKFIVGYFGKDLT